MRLIISFQTDANEIVLAADSLHLSALDALGDGNDNYCYSGNKIRAIKDTGWTLVNAGSGSMGNFHKQLETEVELGMRLPSIRI